MATAQFFEPQGIAVGLNGTIYVSDYGNHCIRQIVGGQVSTLAGRCGQQGFANGSTLTAQFSSPLHLAVDAANNVYVADAGNHRIRLISSGSVFTLAGDGTAGLLDGAVAAARFNLPAGIAVDSSGKVYVADLGNSRIRVVESGGVTTLAGSTSGFQDGPVAQARFRDPQALAIAGAAVLVADFTNYRIRSISAGNVVSTLAGSGAKGVVDGPTQSAGFSGPSDVVAVGAKVYVADALGHRIRIIESGQVATVAGTTAGFRDGASAIAQFSAPGGVGVDSSGRLIIADTNNHRIRMLTP